jgi:hypothetical protein
MLFWEVALNFGLSAWTGIWEKAGEVNNMGSLYYKW